MTDTTLPGKIDRRPHDGTDAEAMPVFRDRAQGARHLHRGLAGHHRALGHRRSRAGRLGVRGLRGGRSRPTSCRVRILIAKTLVKDWGTLSASLWITLRITAAALIAAVSVGVGLAVLFTQSKWLEKSLFPYAVILQVTPVVAIAPLIIIWVGDINLSLLICAWIVAFFPILSNTILGLNSADHNLINLFQLYGASRWQTLRYLRLPAALPYFPRRPEDFRRPRADRRGRGRVRRGLRR
jgi:NitT/TauT family transport system permease protein